MPISLQVGRPARALSTDRAGLEPVTRDRDDHMQML